MDTLAIVITESIISSGPLHTRHESHISHYTGTQSCHNSRPDHHCFVALRCFPKEGILLYVHQARGVTTDNVDIGVPAIAEDNGVSNAGLPSTCVLQYQSLAGGLKW